jgi:hypothetical protein
VEKKQLVSMTSNNIEKMSHVKQQVWYITNKDVELLQQIGSGGSGEVWRGRWRGEQVAVKHLKMY